MKNDLDGAIHDLRECDETQGGVLRALRVLAEEVHRLDAENATLRRQVSGFNANVLATFDAQGLL